MYFRAKLTLCSLESGRLARQGSLHIVQSISDIMEQSVWERPLVLHRKQHRCAQLCVWLLRVLLPRLALPARSLHRCEQQRRAQVPCERAGGSGRPPGPAAASMPVPALTQM